MFFDLKAGRVAWLVADQQGVITGAVKGSQDFLDTHRGLKAFLSEWSIEWIPIVGGAAQFERRTPGTRELRELRLEAVPIIPFAPTGSSSGKLPAFQMLIRVSLPVEHDQLLTSLQDRFALTAAESKVAVIAAEGHTPMEVARRLGLSVHTVRSHLKRIFVKAGVHSQVGLVRAFLEGERDRTHVRG